MDHGRLGPAHPDEGRSKPVLTLELYKNGKLVDSYDNFERKYWNDNGWEVVETDNDTYVIDFDYDDEKEVWH